MFNRLFANVNGARLALATIAVFAFFAIFGFVVHGLFLANTYHQTANLWRPEAEMGDYMGWMWLGKFLLAASFCLIYASGYEAAGKMEGLRFGLLMAPFAIAPKFIYYAVSPIPSHLLWSWVGFGILEIVLAGVICGLVYRRSKLPS